MASVPVTVLLYNGPLLCGFNVPVKGLNTVSNKTRLITLCELSTGNLSMK